MLENNLSESSECCKNCAKNLLLIKKYEKLTHLYEKKQLKLSMNGSSCISNGKSTNNTIDSPTCESPCSKMADVLSRLVKSRYLTFFRVPLPKSAKKFVLLSLFNRLHRSVKARAFTKLKQASNNQASSLTEILTSKLKEIVKYGFMAIKNNSGISVTKQILTAALPRSDQNVSAAALAIQALKPLTCKSSNGSKWLQRRNMELQIHNKKLILQNQALKQCIQELDKRLVRENQKKKETLEELAEEMNQKNQEINHLKDTIRAYEETNQLNGNVLQSDIISMKKDIDQLQRINQRLNNDLDKVKQQLIDTGKKLKASQQKANILQEQHMKMSKLNYQFTLKHEGNQKAFKEYQCLLISLGKKIKRLSVYQRQLLSTSNTNDKPASNTMQQLKSEIILMYLANISDASYELHSKQLFDEEEKSLLNEHKANWIKNLSQNKVKQEVKLQSEVHQMKLDNLQISEIEIKGGHMDSVMNALDFSRENTQQSKCSQGVTMRMLELQLQKNKQVGKISELKEKMLHIRVIILKLLKSFEIQSELKPESRDIMRVLFDLFEYSQEQRDSIFMKKKKLFGFI